MTAACFALPALGTAVGPGAIGSPRLNCCARCANVASSLRPTSSTNDVASPVLLSSSSSPSAASKSPCRSIRYCVARSSSGLELHLSTLRERNLVSNVFAVVRRRNPASMRAITSRWHRAAMLFTLIHSHATMWSRFTRSTGNAAVSN